MKRIALLSTLVGMFFLISTLGFSGEVDNKIQAGSEDMTITASAENTVMERLEKTTVIGKETFSPPQRSVISAKAVLSDQNITDTGK